MEAVAQAPARIHILPPEVADKIAAGEVVERPASVVKELIENSLDAGARHVRVDLEDAGIGVIAVIDDGEGMHADDAVRAFARHATSKVTSVEDLSRITTMGFRGEALASIAAVSTTTLITRRPADFSGTQVLVRGGTVMEVRTVGTAPGTRVEVVDLFGNTPARRKFLKAAPTEVGHVTELVTRTALAWPRVGFTLRHGSRTLLDYAGVADAFERVVQVFGASRAAAMLPFHGRSAAGTVRGWLTGSHLSFPSATSDFHLREPALCARQARESRTRRGVQHALDARPVPGGRRVHRRPHGRRRRERPSSQVGSAISPRWRRPRSHHARGQRTAPVATAAGHGSHSTRGGADRAGRTDDHRATAAPAGTVAARAAADGAAARQSHHML